MVVSIIKKKNLLGHMLIQRQCPSKLAKYLDLVLAAIGLGFTALIGIQVAGPQRKTVSPGVSSRSSYLTSIF